MAISFCSIWIFRDILLKIAYFSIWFDRDIPSSSGLLRCYRHSSEYRYISTSPIFLQAPSYSAAHYQVRAKNLDEVYDIALNILPSMRHTISSVELDETLSQHYETAIENQSIALSEATIREEKDDDSDGDEP